MKKIILFSIVVLFSTLSYSQDQSNEIKLRFNQLLLFDMKESVESEEIELFTLPEEKDRGFNFEVDVSYLRYKEKFGYLIRVGYAQINQSGSLKRVRDTTYTISRDMLKRRTILLGAGLTHAINFKNDKFRTIASLSALLQYKFNNKNSYYSELFDQKDEYLSGFERTIDYPNSFRAGLSFEVGFIYYFMKKLGLGIELNNYLYIDRNKGITKDTQSLLNEEKMIINSFVADHNEKNIRIGKTFSFSLALSYQF